MAKDRRKLQHIHSSVPDKQPTAASLEVGEIAVNNAANQEFLSIKNSSSNVVRFSSDEQIITWTEKKEVIPYSGTVDNVHLDTNRSNIEIKLNQVVASNTVKHNEVNGAKDIDGNLVNPTTDGGLTNGAGFAIDMSQYAMIGANPSFSSVTVTNRTTLNGTTNINGDTNITGNTNITNNLTVGGTVCPTSGLCKNLSWSYGDVKNASSGETNFKENKSLVIPKCASDINRGTLGYTYGDVKNLGGQHGVYDPGENCNGVAETDSIVIPTSIDDLEEWNGTCFTISHPLCVNGTITASGNIYSTSDRRKKENIQILNGGDATKTRNIPLVSFNFIEDPEKRKVYGVIAQDVINAGLENVVNIDEKGMYSVDYTSLLILKIANLEYEVGSLHDRIKKLEEKINNDQ